MELNRVLDQVRKLTALAEHPATDPTEAAAFAAKADALMIKYAIDQAAIRAAAPADQQIKPVAITVEIGTALTGLSRQLAEILASHNRCQIRVRGHYEGDKYTFRAKVYGYEHDVRFFELQYTTIRLHMTGILRPKFEAGQTFEANCYALHEAGYNWLEMAKMQGWHKVSLYSLSTDELTDLGKASEAWRNAETGEVRSNTKLGSAYKRAYERECARLGRPTTKVPASASRYYRADAAQGYMVRIQARLRRLEDSRETGGSALVLSADSVLDYFREENAELFCRCPKCAKLSASPYDCDRCGHHIKDATKFSECPRCKAAKSGHCRDHPKGSFSYRNWNESAYNAGRRHADSADLSGNARTESTIRREIG